MKSKNEKVEIKRKGTHYTKKLMRKAYEVMLMKRNKRHKKGR